MRYTALFIAAALTCAATAQEMTSARPPGASEPTRQLLEQKEVLARRLLNDSPAAKRVAASSSDEAKRYMGAAHALHAKALTALQEGELTAADAALNDALWMIGKARQLVPDTMYRVIEWRFRYARLQDVVDALYGSFERHALKASTGRTSAEQEEIARLIGEARSFRTSEQIPEAVSTLERAQSMLLVAFNKVLGSRTLEYTQTFETAADEFGYEAQRNQAYVELVPIAIAQLKPTPEALRLVARYVDTNHALVQEAQRLAAKKSFAAAVKTMKDGTVSLQRAIAAAGLIVPQDDRIQ